MSPTESTIFDSIWEEAEAVRHMNGVIGALRRDIFQMRIYECWLSGINKWKQILKMSKKYLLFAWPR